MQNKMRICSTIQVMNTDPLASPEILAKAAVHLSKNDPRLAPIIAATGLATLEPHQDYYRALADSIIGQQLSVKAASTIKLRFRELFGGNFPEPEAILERSVEELRTAGLSGAKAAYIQDLALHILDGRVRFDTLADQTNAEITTDLTAVKGIGEWTAHMFLMFCVGRTDVLAYGDLGVRAAVKIIYDFTELPTKQEVEKIARDNKWHPYESVACWYLWRSLDNAPE
jgi:DNA-3-methyladenine glycosylase II